ncbi:MAG: hypothetical protein U0903_08425 [Planctomycetales bacterium]
MDLLAELQSFETSALEAIRSAVKPEELEAARIHYLGAKNGKLKDLQALLGKVPKEEKPLFGKRLQRSEAGGD